MIIDPLVLGVIILDDIRTQFSNCILGIRILGVARCKLLKDESCMEKRTSKLEAIVIYGQKKSSRTNARGFFWFKIEGGFYL